MNFSTAQLITGCSEPPFRCAVKAGTLLSEIIGMLDELPQACLLVEDDAGNPVGIADMEVIRRRIWQTSPLERARWLDMTVESALTGRIDPPVSPSASASDSFHGSGRMAAVSQHGRLIAIASDDDVLISWRTVERSLRTAMDDAVTSLPNRAAFDACLRAEFARARRFEHSLAVILADVDRFKSINDRFGHAAGDAVLSAVGRALRKPLRSYDLVARFGGDEFAIVSSGFRPGEIDVTVQRLRLSAEDLRRDPSIPQPAPTLSIGVCVAHDPAVIGSPDDLVEIADECLYQAKHAGRDCAVCRELGVSDVPPVSNCSDNTP